MAVGEDSTCDGALAEGSIVVLFRHLKAHSSLLDLRHLLTDLVYFLIGVLQILVVAKVLLSCFDVPVQVCDLGLIQFLWLAMLLNILIELHFLLELPPIK